MQTCVHLWQYLAEFLEWEMFHTEVLEKMEAHLCVQYSPPPKIALFMSNV